MSYYGDLIDEMHKQDTPEMRAKDAEIARLRAELEALKPKSVVRIKYAAVLDEHTMHPRVTVDPTEDNNLKLIFEDGKLVRAEVI